MKGVEPVLLLASFKLEFERSNDWRGRGRVEFCAYSFPIVESSF